MSTREEMIAHERTVDEIAAELGRDSLAYISLAGVYEAVAASAPTAGCRLHRRLPARRHRGARGQVRLRAPPLAGRSAPRPADRRPGGGRRARRRGARGHACATAGRARTPVPRGAAPGVPGGRTLRVTVPWGTQQVQVGPVRDAAPRAPGAETVRAPRGGRLVYVSAETDTAALLPLARRPGPGVPDAALAVVAGGHAYPLRGLPAPCGPRVACSSAPGARSGSPWTATPRICACGSPTTAVRGARPAAAPTGRRLRRPRRGRPPGPAVPARHPVRPRALDRALRPGAGRPGADLRPRARRPRSLRRRPRLGAAGSRVADRHRRRRRALSLRPARRRVPQRRAAPRRATVYALDGQRPALSYPLHDLADGGFKVPSKPDQAVFDATRGATGQTLSIAVAVDGTRLANGAAGPVSSGRRLARWSVKLPA